MASSDSQISKPQCGHPKRAELPDVNINTGAQSINTERASLTAQCQCIVQCTKLHTEQVSLIAKITIATKRRIMYPFWAQAIKMMSEGQTAVRF